MFGFLKRRRLRALAPRLVDDLAPKIETSKVWVAVCQVQATPRALLEAGIAELFSVHQSVLAGTEDEDARTSILPAVHERFLRDFVSVYSEAGLQSGEVVTLSARRLATYDSLMDRSLPEWHLRLAEQIFESMTGNRAETPVCWALGIVVLGHMTSTTRFLKGVLR